MRKMIMIMVMITAVFLISGCQTTTVPDSCEATLGDILEDSLIMDITGVKLTEAKNVPIPGGEADQMLVLNEETLILSRYASSEKAAEQLTPAALQETFSGIGTIIEDSPAVYGDETSWVQLNDGSATELAIARYGDRLAIGQSVSEAGIQENLNGFDVDLLAYISDHPECAYLHPETR